MNTTPKSMRLHIGICGRTNVGKSSFLNMIAGQDVAITSRVAGTTTDVVEKTMELLPIGPVMFLDTAGIDDKSELSAKRMQKTWQIFDRSDVIVIITEPNVWTSYETSILEKCREKNTPAIIIVNKIDTDVVEDVFSAQLMQYSKNIIFCSSIDKDSRDKTVNIFKEKLIDVCPDGFLNPPPLVEDLVMAGETAVLIVPIDLEAPKGRLILPQVQTIRSLLDNDAAALVVKEREYLPMLNNLKEKPSLVICDSQVVQKMVADTPTDIPCTTFSILFSRLKGDLAVMAKGAMRINDLKDGDKILISEACSHHALEDDIGRVKIPRWIRQYTGLNLHFDVYAGQDYPENIDEYALVIHCGGCMINRRLMLSRMQKALEKNVAITNYGLAISLSQGVLKRVLSPFPSILELIK